MASGNDYEQRVFFAKIKRYEENIHTLLTLEKKFLEEIKKHPETAAVKHIAIANDMLNVVSNYLVISGIYESVVNAKNSTALENARKALYKSIVYLEQTVTNLVDAPFSEYEEQILAIASVDANARYSLVKKMGLSVELLKNAFGRKSRWKWPLVEMEARFAIVAKNIIDLRKAVENRDPRSPAYESTVYHLRLVKKALSLAADAYYEKFEINSRDLGDLRKGINILYALKRFCAVLGDRGETEILNKKLNNWNAKYENNIKRG